MEDLSVCKIGRRLAYILRYGAVNEGLNVTNDGYAKLDDILQLDLLQHDTKKDVLLALNRKTVTGQRRFDLMSQDRVEFVRASFGRNFAPAQKHQNSGVNRLLEICMAYVCSHIKTYDLTDFPDEYLLSRIYYRLKFEKKLTNSVMPNVIGKVMDEISFNNVYITEKTLKLICKRCPNLKSLSLKGCGYIVTDNVLQWLLKGLRNLTKLNICCCKSVTDKGLNAISESGKNIEQLNISYLRLVSRHGLKALVSSCLCLKQLYVQGNQDMDDDFIEELITLRKAEYSSEVSLSIFTTCNT